MADKRIGGKLVLDTSDYEQKLARSKAALSGLQVVSRNTSHSMVTDVQATSGALRLMEGGMTGNIRAAERFLASIKGVGAAMQFIYPAVGLIAVGGVIAKTVEELVNFSKKAKEAGLAFQLAFQDRINSTRLSNDELAKSNIELDNQIKKLTGKHENVLAEQIMDARIEADHLAESAAKAFTETQKLLKENETGFFARLSGTGADEDIQAKALGFAGQFRDAATRKAEARQHGDETHAIIAQSDMEDSTSAEIAYYKQQIAERKGYVKYDPTGQLVTASKDDGHPYSDEKGDQTKNINTLQDLLAIAYQRQDTFALSAQHASSKDGEEAAAEKKRLADLAKADAEKASAAQRKADSDHLTALHDQFELLKSAAPMQTYETKENFEQRQRLAQSSFYMGHLNDFKTAEGRKQAFDLGQNPLNEYNTTDTEGRAALQKMLAGNGSSEGIFAGLGSDKDTQARLKAQQEAISAQAELANKLRETAVAQELEAGTISKHDAAVQMAAMHTAAYNVELAKLQAEAKQIAQDPTLDEAQRKTKAAQNQSQIDDLNQNQAAQTKQDQNAVSDQTALGGWKTALDQFVSQSRDTAAQVKDIWSSALSSVNDELVKIISTRHNYGLRQTFGNLGAGMFRNVASAGLQKGEGALLGALGFGGKPDGSASKPLHVIIAGALGAASAAGGLFSKAASGASGVGDLVSGGVKAAASHAGGIMSTIGGLFSGLGFADGGDPPVGKMSIVGEKGIEGFVPKTAGTIVPNHMLGGGSVTHNWTVDARGATDPAAVNAAVNRAIYKAQPALTAASMNASRESNARKNPAARR